MTASGSPGLGSCEELLATAYDTALLDLDGVVYVGEHAVAGAADSLAATVARGMRLAYVTNNASRTPEAVAAHLTSLGIPAEPNQVVTSAQAAARLVAGLVPAGSAVLVIGGAGLAAALRAHGLVPVHRLEDSPAAVVQGFGPDVDWSALAEGGFAVARGLPWVAANLDRTIPTARGRAPGNGTLVDAVAAAAGRRPDAVAGKPELALHREAVMRSGAIRPLVVGDRLDTDIEGAYRAGTDSLLVFTGVTDLAELFRAEARWRPTYVAPDVSGLLGHQPRVDLLGGAAGGPGGPAAPTARCAGWTAWIEGAAVDVRGGGDRGGGLRAACSLAWRHLDDGGDALEPSARLRRLATQSATAGSAT